MDTNNYGRADPDIGLKRTGRASRLAAAGNEIRRRYKHHCTAVAAGNQTRYHLRIYIVITYKKKRWIIYIYLCFSLSRTLSARRYEYTEQDTTTTTTKKAGPVRSVRHPSI